MEHPNLVVALIMGSAVGLALMGLAIALTLRDIRHELYKIRVLLGQFVELTRYNTR